LKAGRMFENEKSEETENMILELGEEKQRLGDLNNTQDADTFKLDQEAQPSYNTKVSVQHDVWNYKEIYLSEETHQASKHNLENPIRIAYQNKFLSAQRRKTRILRERIYLNLLKRLDETLFRCLERLLNTFTLSKKERKILKSK
jgi:hypothetical protein